MSAELTVQQLAQTELVYQQAFPQHLRVPFADLATPGSVQLMIVAFEGAEPVSFAAMMLLDRPGWTFLRYYGVAAARRREGVGLRLWRQLPAAVRTAGWPTRIVLEVEDPGQASRDPAEQRVRLGRIAFWQHCGARLLPVERYVMPDITGLAAPEPMQLMACDAMGSADLPPAELAALVTALYKQRYGLAADHPLVASALASID
jgi:hypothetical protein